MTIAADLQSRHGCERMLVLRLDGLDMDIVTGTRRTLPSGGTWRTTVIPGLVCDQQYSVGLDYRTGRMQPGQLDIGIRNLWDTSLNRVPTANDGNTLYYFAQLFAPGRWQASWTRTVKDSSSTQWMDADTSNVYIQHNPTDRGLSSSGTAYIAGQAFTYSGTSGPTGSGTDQYWTLTGCVMGKFPCVGSLDWWQTIQLADDDDHGDAPGHIVSANPWVGAGHRAALYITTWDRATQAWNALDDDFRLFTGRVAARRYDREKGMHVLSLDDLIKDLKQKICVDLPSADLEGIYPFYRKFDIWEHFVPQTGAPYSYKTTITVTAQHYRNVNELLAELWAQIKGASWVDSAGASATSGCTYSPGLAPDGAPRMRVKNNTANTGVTVVFDGAPYNHCDVFAACGWPRTFDGSPGFSDFTVQQADPSAWYSSFVRQNTDRIYADLENPSGDQGDAAGVSRSYVKLNTVNPAWLGVPGAFTNALILAITGKTSNYLNVDPIQQHQPNDSVVIGARADDDAITVQEVYAPISTVASSTEDMRGPFELLLYPLLSTGSGNNHATYDALPPKMSVGIQADLVDIDSFLKADQAVIAQFPDAAERIRYAIDKGIGYDALFDREGRIFGQFIAWGPGGKLRVSSLGSTRIDTWVRTLSRSNNATIRDHSAATIEVDHVVNVWEAKIGYSLSDGKFQRDVTMIDWHSRHRLGVTQAIKIEHPGLFSEGNTTGAIEMLAKLFKANRNFWGHEAYRISTTIAPTLLHRIHVGDAVKVQLPNFPDPYGSGAMSVDAYAVVTNLAWALGGQDAWTGVVDLLVHSQIGGEQLMPWAPAALVDIEATNGGWDAGAYELTLVAKQYCNGTNHDGDAFQNGDAVRIIEIGTDPTSVTEYSGTVDSYDSGTRVLSLQGTPSFGTWSATSEHLVVPADYGSATTSQKSRASWHAGRTDALLGTDAAQHYS